MTELKNVEDKQKVSAEIRELVRKINQIIDTAPMFLKIRFNQNDPMTLSKNSHLSVFISETIVYV